MTMPQEDQPILASLYGFAEATTAFHQRHPHWKTVMAHLEEAVNLAITRVEVMRDRADKFVYNYGRLVAEDFMELFLMAVNGYGFAAMKLLRSMYEHTVTLKYLHDNPNEIHAFISFDRVQQHRLTKQIIETFGEGALSAETRAAAERDYAEVKDAFMVKSCKSKTCDETRVGHTWSKLDFVTMAKKARTIGFLSHCPGYFVPLRHTHSSVSSNDRPSRNG